MKVNGHIYIYIYIKSDKIQEPHVLNQKKVKDPKQCVSAQQFSSWLSRKNGIEAFSFMGGSSSKVFNSTASHPSPKTQKPRDRE